MIDSLDSKEWLEQVQFIMKALSDEEDGDPLITQWVKEMIKLSIKSDPLKPLHKIVTNMGDLEEIIHTITNYCANLNHIMFDLTERLNKMKQPRTKMSMYSNCKLISELIGDSQSALQGLYTQPKDILFRSVQSKVLDLALNISTKFNKIRLQFMWSVAANNPSDLNSKITNRIIEKSNSQFWRAGLHGFYPMSN